MRLCRNCGGFEAVVSIISKVGVSLSWIYVTNAAVKKRGDYISEEFSSQRGRLKR